MTSESQTTHSPVRALLGSDSDRLLGAIDELMLETLAPNREKKLRLFTSGEVAELLNMQPGSLRKLIAEKKIPDAEHGTGTRRLYSGEEILELRRILSKTSREPRKMLPIRQNNEQLQILACLTFKGGSGKTTSSIHLSQWFALHGYRVLVVDMDPQASLTTLLGLRPHLDIGDYHTVYDALRYAFGRDDVQKPMSSVVRKTYFPNLDLAPAGLILSEYETETPYALQHNEPQPFYTRLRDAIDSVANDYDLVFIDCPPQLGFLTLTAMTAATSLVIPVVPNMIDIASLGQFLTMADSALTQISEAGWSFEYDFIRYLLCRYEPTDGPQTQIAAFLRNQFPGRVMVNPFLKSTAIADAGMTSDTIYEVDRNQLNRGTLARALESVNLVAEELEREIHAVWGRK